MVAGATAAAGAIMIATTTGAAAAGNPHAAAPTGKITICHRTDADNNPYITETISANAVIHAGHLDHTGSVWFPGHSKEPKWGDIVPPFTYKGVTYSLNWPAGEAILDNGCQPVTAPSSTPVTSEVTTPITNPSNNTSTPVSRRTTATVPNGPVAAPSTGLIPAGVQAGLHTPITTSGLQTWGVMLLLFGGIGGLAVGLWPTRRRAH